MGMDSKARELLTIWHELSPKTKTRMLEKTRYVALATGLEKTPEFEALFELPAADSDRNK
jgi:hypothetical protein